MKRAFTSAGLNFSSLPIAVLILLSSVIPCECYEYEVTVIEALPGYEKTEALGINSLEQVVGSFYNVDPETGKARNRRAFIWKKTEGARLLPSLGGESSAWAINENGFISGYSYTAEGYRRGVVWDSTGENVTDAGTLENGAGTVGNESRGYGINGYRYAVGNADIANDDGSFVAFHAFQYNPTSGIENLGTLTTDVPEWQNGYSIAYDVNINGEIVGTASAYDGAWKFSAFVREQANAMQALQKDPANVDGEWYASVINDSGLIGGHVFVATNKSLPYYWPEKSSAPSKIGMPEAFPYGEIYGINVLGQVVGMMWDSDEENATEHAFIFDSQHGVRDLNAVIDPAAGWILNFARDINDKGQIVGCGELNGQTRGFVLFSTGSAGALKGDVDNNSAVSLADAILTLQVMTAVKPPVQINSQADVNNDGRIGMEEAIYILGVVSGVR